MTYKFLAILLASLLLIGCSTKGPCNQPGMTCVERTKINQW